MGRVGVFYSCKINTIVIDVSVSKKLFFSCKAAHKYTYYNTPRLQNLTIIMKM